MKFPVEIEFKGQRAKTYRPAKGFAFYRISFRMAGKRRMLTFGTYGEAKKAAEEKVRELHNGQQSAGLTAKQSQDAIVALQRLAELTHATGSRVSLLSAVSEFADASTLLKGRSLIETAQTFLLSIASVKRRDISEAVEEFVTGREAKTQAPAGQRAQLSVKKVVQHHPAGQRAANCGCRPSHFGAGHAVPTPARFRVVS